jgi:bacterial surface protein 26-residue repeat/prepilin-type N-terminal cleavage/methylation domain
MKKNKGFTLVEVLAVIIIIAVIGLITTPLILNVIEDSRKNAFKESAFALMRVADLAYTKIRKEEVDFDDSRLDYEKKTFTGGTIYFVNGRATLNNITNGRYCANGTRGDLIIKEGDCNVDLATAPILKRATTAATSPFLDIGIAKNEIESIEFVNVSSFPAGATDVSQNGDGKVKLWKKDENNDSKFEIYIGAVNDYVYANPNSNYLFSNLLNIVKIDLENFDTSTATNMVSMFNGAGGNQSSFELNLGRNFDTSKVKDMSYMFYYTGYKSQGFHLSLGEKFNTKNVENMNSMFYYFSSNTYDFKLDLGNKFDTSKVTNMHSMFYYAASESNSVVLNLGNNFNSKNVTDMGSMFMGVGYASINTRINLGNNFDTSNVTNMDNMFDGVGAKWSPSVTINLGKKFDTSKVETMAYMFHEAGSKSSTFELNLGELFNVSSLLSGDSGTIHTFHNTGLVNPSFKPKAQVKTQTQKNAILARFPNIEVTVKP